MSPADVHTLPPDPGEPAGNEDPAGPAEISAPEPPPETPVEPAPRVAEVVEAIDFHPTEQPEAARFRIRPLRAVVLSVFVVLGLLTWFMFTAKAVRLQLDPAPDSVAVDGGWLAFELGGRWLLRPGTYRVRARKEGYHPLTEPIEVGPEPNQEFSMSLEKLPGLLAVRSHPADGAGVFVDGIAAGVTPLDAVEVSPGEHEISIRAERYLEYSSLMTIEGGGVQQELVAELIPAWAAVTLSSRPAGATVLIDGETVGTTPVSTDLLAGTREVEVKLPGYKTWQTRLTVIANEPRTLPEISLENADGLVSLRSNPPGASVTVEGVYRGQTPLQLALPPDKTYAVNFSKAGFKPASRSISVRSDEDTSLSVQLQANLGSVRLITRPAGAEVYVDGEYAGSADQRLMLPAAEHVLEIRKPGYAPHRTTVTPRPGFNQEIAVTLKTLEQARVDAIPRVLTTSEGHELVLVQPGRFTMGASRREPGRRANEGQREVEITRMFYIGAREVTNRQFNRFQNEHSSGKVQRIRLDQADRPVVRLSWEQAASYCNWLSEKESLPPAYYMDEGRLVAVEPLATGYRLPTEAEWAWAGRYAGRPTATRYPWGGDLPPSPDSGNYADTSAQNVVPTTLSSYTDRFAATAPVGKFPPNALGLFDMGGNVAEWTHDYYSVSPGISGQRAIDPRGPADGEYHVIRGSSWMHGGVSELRLSYRDYADKPRPDVGFRIARFLE